jgi:hypothetical protein
MMNHPTERVMGVAIPIIFLLKGSDLRTNHCPSFYLFCLVRDLLNFFLIPSNKKAAARNLIFG